MSREVYSSLANSKYVIHLVPTPKRRKASNVDILNMIDDMKESKCMYLRNIRYNEETIDVLKQENHDIVSQNLLGDYKYQLMLEYNNKDIERLKEEIDVLVVKCRQLEYDIEHIYDNEISININERYDE